MLAYRGVVYKQRLQDRDASSCYNNAMTTSKSSASFLDCYTEHYAELTWWWDEKNLHNMDYHIMVNDKIAAKLRELESKYDFQNDTTYCCQWEGVLLVSGNAQDVQRAGAELASFIARFKGVVPIP
jgi:hypothetical protein